jgi:hypothetical protein
MSPAVVSISRLKFGGCVQGIRKFAADAIVLEGILREKLKE